MSLVDLTLRVVDVHHGEDEDSVGVEVVGEHGLLLKLDVSKSHDEEEAEVWLTSPPSAKWRWGPRGKPERT